MRQESRLSRDFVHASSAHGVGSSVNGWKCQFDVTKLVPVREVQLGMISEAKVSHEADPYSRMAEDWHASNLANSEPWEQSYELPTES